MPVITNHRFDAVCFNGPNPSLKGRYADSWAVQEKPDGAIYQKQAGCDIGKIAKPTIAKDGEKQKTVKEPQTYYWEGVTGQKSSKFKRYLWEVLCHQWGRHIAWSLLFFTTNPSSAWLLACNHGQLLTCPLTAVSLTRFLKWYTNASLLDRGYDIRYTYIDNQITHSNFPMILKLH